jgi:hypothetical protein
VSDKLKVKVCAYKGYLVIEVLHPESPQENWHPIGPGRIGCVLADSKTMLGVSAEALEFLRKVPRSHDAIGDVDWWACDNGRKAFSWIGGVKAIFGSNAEGSRKFTMYPDDCIGIPNVVPEEARAYIDDKDSQ